MLKAMLSQPMAGKTEQEIVETRDRAIMTLKERGSLIRHTPTVEHYGNIDISANAVFDVATREDRLRFRETDEMCPRCQRDIEVYYCENRTYIVRCKHCHIVTLVSARNPDEAAAKVGLHVKPVRHGRWERMDEYCNHSKTFRCSVCKSDVEYSYFTRFCEYDYCPNCGAKMDLEV